MKIVKSIEEPCFLIKCGSETIKNERKDLKEVFFSVLLGALAASLLENLLAGKGAIATGTFRADDGTIRASQDF